MACPLKWERPKLYKDREHTLQEICQMMGISKPPLYQYLREMGDKSS